MTDHEQSHFDESQALDALRQDPAAAALMDLHPSEPSLTAPGVVYEAGRAVGREEGLREARAGAWRPRLALAASWAVAAVLGLGWVTSSGTESPSGGGGPSVVSAEDDGVASSEHPFTGYTFSEDPERRRLTPAVDRGARWVAEEPPTWWALALRSAAGLDPVREAGLTAPRSAGAGSVAWPRDTASPWGVGRRAGEWSFDAWDRPASRAGGGSVSRGEALRPLSPRDALDLELDGLEGWPGPRRRSPAPAEPDASPRWWEVWVG